ncbi:testis-expressed protein 13C-1 [Nannospalax galili]|uniref:testis-expressed protein 13C-1 n=1 Tax=Nannospalax galili TaxID=1026970 RepID=UPI0004ED2B0C|nr:testis-expressed protein 13C-1 [Nannospalax galili]
MAVEFGDHASGFHHTEVIRFINNEITMNGGGSEFYVNYRSRPWNEIEDQLQVILVDPKVPHSLKRACTWSALALSVRVAARQREQQACKVGRLQDQLGEYETVSCTLASELQQLHNERDQAAAQLQITQTALQEAVDECEVLRGRLLQAERSAMYNTLPWGIACEPGVEEYWTAPWSLNEQEQANVASWRGQNIPLLEAHVPFPISLLCVPESPVPWVQAVYPLSVNLPFFIGVPHSIFVPCPLVIESGATAATVNTAVSQIVTAGIYSTDLWAQEEMAPMWEQISQRQNECHEIFQGRFYMEDSRLHCQEDTEKPQDTTPSGDNSNHNHTENQIIPQGMAPTSKKEPAKETAVLELNISHSIKEDSLMPPETAAQGNTPRNSQKKYPGILMHSVHLGDDTSNNTKEDSVTCQQTAAQGNTPRNSQKKYPGIPWRISLQGNSINYNQKEDPNMPQERGVLGDSNRHYLKEEAVIFQQKTPLGNGGNHNQRKAQEMPQGMTALRAGRSQSQKEVPNRHQTSPLGKTKRPYVSKYPKKQLSPKQKTKQMSRSKVAEPKPQKKPDLNLTPMNWVCPLCKDLNRPQSKACYKCGKVCALNESQDTDPRQIH